VSNRRGSAYVFVLVAVLMMMMLVSVALAVTVASRRTTAYYSDFASLYDLAVAGNEQVLFFLREAFYPGAENPMLPLQAAVAAAYPRSWTFSVEWAVDERDPLTHTFRANTAVTPLGDRFRVQTQVYHYALIPIPATVRAYIVLDGNTLAMVESMRITQ